MSIYLLSRVFRGDISKDESADDCPSVDKQPKIEKTSVYL